MIKKKNARAWLLFVCSLFVIVAHAQDSKRISGIVNDADGTPLQKATVQVKGTQTYAMTNEKGLFVITVPKAGKTLVVTYVGMPSKEVDITGEALQVIAMSNVAGTLSDVVVIGYGTTSRSNVSTAISSVSEKDLKNLVTTGVDQAIQGKVAGVTVTNNSGQPGGGVSMRVRGVTTINSNDPLVVIDGVPFTSNTVSNSGFDALGGSNGQTGNSVLATLNPNDIASVDILKDASAQAIYGSQAANGVILITTKKGKKGDGKIAYDFYIGQSKIAKKLDMMNLQEFATYQNQLATPDGVTPHVIDSMPEFKDPSILGSGTNWQEAIFRPANVQSHQLSFSGGTDKTNYYISLGYFDQEGVLIGSAFNRYSTRFSLDHQIKKWAKIGMSSNISRSNQNVTLADAAESTIWWAAILSPLVPLKNLDGTWAGASTNTTAGMYNSNALNPVASANLRGNKTINNNIFGNVYADVNLLKWLSLRNEVSYSLSYQNNDAFQKDATIGTYSQISKLIQNRSNSYYYNLRNFFNINRSFNKHSINAVLGHEAQYGYWEQIAGSKPSLVNGILDLNAGSTDALTWGLSGGKSDWAIESYFARANYTFDNRYNLSASIRRDGSSKFAPKKRWGYFPAVSGAWTVTNEKFAESIKSVLNYFKIRAGYGEVGNQNPPGGAPNPLFNSSVGVWNGAVGFGTSTYLNGIANPDVTWETVASTNLGIDFSLFKNKLEVSLDLYNKSTKNMLIFSTGAAYLGIGDQWNDLKAPVGNTGKMTNTGLDLTINYSPIKSKDFDWKITGIFSTFKNKLDNLANLTSSLDGKVYYDGYLLTHTTPGNPVGTFWGLKTDGLFRTQEDLNNSLPQFGYSVDEKHTWLGDVRFKDISGPDGKPDGVIDASDFTNIGTPYPKFTYGLTNNFGYKGFDLSIFLQGSYGADIYNFLRWQTEGMANPYWNQTKDVLNNRYTAANTKGELPRFTSDNVNNRYVSDRYIEDGSYMRIQNITLGYRLPNKIAGKSIFSNARIYITAQNLHTFTKYSGYDPEIGSYNSGIKLQNVDMGHYPIPRTFTAGINVEF